MRRFALILVIAAAATSVQAENLDGLYKRMNEFVAKKNYPKALEEIAWMRKEVEKLHMAKIQEYFPDQLGGYAGDKFKPNSMMGMTNIERTYSKDKSRVKASLVGGSAGGAMGGLAGIARMGAMMQQQQGQDSFRLGGLTASLDESRSRPELTVFMDSGYILKLETLKDAEGSDLRTLVEQLKVGELDAYLKGTAG